MTPFVLKYVPIFKVVHCIPASIAYLETTCGRGMQTLLRHWVCPTPDPPLLYSYLTFRLWIFVDINSNQASRPMEILVTTNHCNARDVASVLVLACFRIPPNLKRFYFGEQVALATDALLVRKLSRER